jgi:hypothetical protein
VRRATTPDFCEHHCFLRARDCYLSRLSYLTEARATFVGYSGAGQFRSEPVPRGVSLRGVAVPSRDVGSAMGDSGATSLLCSADNE